MIKKVFTAIDNYDMNNSVDYKWLTYNYLRAFLQKKTEEVEVSGENGVTGIEVSLPDTVGENEEHEVLLNKAIFEKARVSCLVPLANICNVGEMFCQQYNFSPFSNLLLSASYSFSQKIANGEMYNYRANQEIKCSLSCISTENDHDPEKHGFVVCSPDGAWDPFSMMELKPSDKQINKPEYKLDCERCMLSLASTAVLLSRMPMTKRHIVLPFLIGTRNIANLYVVCVEDNGAPQVKVVMERVRITVHRMRLKLFAALALLLMDFKQHCT